jgi:tRNA(fMet)-specific endonuclease VapC
MDYLLDSDTCISFLKDQYSIANKIESVGLQNCYVSEITIAELTFGAYRSNNFEKHIDEVKLIQSLYSIVPIYSSIEFYAQEKSRLKQSGNLIPDFDLLIGSTAVTNGMVMVTSNVKHLNRIESHTAIHWYKHSSLR